MEKLYDRIDWANNTTPALNQTNLNKMSKALDDLDDRVIEIAGTVMETVPQVQEDLEEVQELVEELETIAAHTPYIGENGDWWVWDDATEQYIDSGTAANGKSAYDYAEEGGYEGTESQFYSDLGDLGENIDTVQELIAEVGATQFSVDFATGNLIYTENDHFLFSVNYNNGNLEWEVVA